MALSWDFKRRSGVISLHEFFLLQRFGWLKYVPTFFVHMFSIAIGSCSSTVSQHSFDATQHPKKSRRPLQNWCEWQHFNFFLVYLILRITSRLGPQNVESWSYTAIFLWLRMIYHTDVQPYNLNCNLYINSKLEPFGMVNTFYLTALQTSRTPVVGCILDANFFKDFQSIFPNPKRLHSFASF